MQPLSPGGTAQSVPAPPGLPAQRPAQPDSLGGSVWSLQGPAAPLLLLPLTQVLPLAGQPSRAPRLAGGHPCPILAASPCSQLPGVGSGQVVRRIMREAGRCELVSASSSDLGPPSLLLTFPATQGSSSQRPTPPPLQVLLKLCCGSESPGEGSESTFLGSSPEDSDPGGHTRGAWEFAFLSNSPVDWDAGSPLNTL